MADAEIIKDRLTGKQQAFINAYLGEAKFNATKAARIAGYALPSEEGYRLLRNVQISSRIRERFEEQTLAANEVLARLSQHSTCSIEPFVRQHGNNISFDILSEEAKASLHLVKRIKTKKKSGGSGDRAWSESEVEFEMYDAQQALAHLGRFHKLFTDRTENVDPELDAKIEAQLEKLKQNAESDALATTEQ